MTRASHGHNQHASVNDKSAAIVPTTDCNPSFWKPKKKWCHSSLTQCCAAAQRLVRWLMAALSFRKQVKIWSDVTQSSAYVKLSLYLQSTKILEASRQAPVLRQRWILPPVLTLLVDIDQPIRLCLCLVCLISQWNQSFVSWEKTALFYYNRYTGLFPQISRWPSKKSTPRAPLSIKFCTDFEYSIIDSIASIEAKKHLIQEQYHLLMRGEVQKALKAAWAVWDVGCLWMSKISTSACEARQQSIFYAGQIRQGKKERKSRMNLDKR